MYFLGWGGGGGQKLMYMQALYERTIWLKVKKKSMMIPLIEPYTTMPGSVTLNFKITTASEYETEHCVFFTCPTTNLASRVQSCGCDSLTACLKLLQCMLLANWWLPASAKRDGWYFCWCRLCESFETLPDDDFCWVVIWSDLVFSGMGKI